MRAHTRKHNRSRASGRKFSPNGKHDWHATFDKEGNGGGKLNIHGNENCNGSAFFIYQSCFLILTSGSSVCVCLRFYISIFKFWESRREMANGTLIHRVMHLRASLYLCIYTSKLCLEMGFANDFHVDYCPCLRK